jgi:hypothetical protein
MQRIIAGLRIRATRVPRPGAQRAGNRPGVPPLRLAFAAAWTAGLLGLAPVPTTAQRPPSLLTNVAQLRALSPAHANLNLPVRLRGIVTYFDPDWRLAFLADGEDAVYVNPLCAGRPRTTRRHG